MDGLLLFLVGFTLLFLIYLYLHTRLSALIEKRLHELYRKDLQKDISDFYREMESYAALIESKINRYKNLVERHEALLGKWENLSLELKKNKKTREISEVIEKSLEKEEKILELLEKNLSLKNPPLVEKNPKETRETAKTAPTETPSFEPNFALEILEEEKSRPYPKKAETKPNLETTVPYLAQEKVQKNWQNFFRQIGRLFLPQEKAPPDFATLVNLPPKPKEKPPEPTTTHNEKSLAVKKIDPVELSQLAEKMQKDPASRPAILRILLQHNIPLTMISHLTGIELSQLEAIRQLYKL